MNTRKPLTDIVWELRRLALLSRKLETELKVFCGKERLDPAELSVLRWARDQGITQAEARRRLGWSEKTGSSKISALERKQLLRLELCPEDHRRNLLVPGVKCDEVLKQHDSQCAEAFARAAPELEERADKLRAALARATGIVVRAVAVDTDRPDPCTETSGNDDAP